MPDTKPVAIQFEAEVRQVKSMADHTYNIVLNVPEYCLKDVQVVMAWLGDQVDVAFVNIPDSRKPTGKHGPA